MPSNIRIFTSASNEQIIAEAMERYSHMETHRARAAIMAEWPEHMARILSPYVAVTNCPASRNAYRSIESTNKTNIDAYVDLLIDRRGNP
jgi:hypothetical protein